MKTLLQIALICFAGSGSSQVLDWGLAFPSRATNALTGSEFAQKVSAMDLPQREQAIYQEVFDGNVPLSLRKFCPVTVTNITEEMTNIGTFYVAPDYLAVGSDSNYLLMPISGNTAQRIADKIGCTLPTRKMVDAIYAAAEVKLAPSPIAPTAAMTTVPVFVQHNETVRAERAAVLDAYPLGALVAGHKKDVVVTTRLNTATNKIAIYGWHRLTNGVAIQPLYLGHVSWWVDYSQCIRFISYWMTVNGERKTVPEVLADPKLCGLISDEGVITNARYPTNFVSPPVVAEKISLRWPKKFDATANFGEWTREIKLPDDVRIIVSAPAKESFSQDKPVLLVFYALPNGNTIEQTIGKNINPNDDWHFDIQHIGAQTRWLRNEITNRTIVVAYLEAGMKSWPAWRKKYNDARIAEIIDGVRGIFRSNKTEVVLASHSGGGSLVFGYLNAVGKIPSDVKRIAFLDSNYGYDSKLHANKIRNWLTASAENHLLVLAYQDYLGLLDGKTFVSEAGGTWSHSLTMMRDLQSQLSFKSQTSGELETYSALEGRIEFLLKENPDHKIFHTVQVERNGFIHALLAGTADAGKGYEYFGERAYTNWIH